MLNAISARDIRGMDCIQSIMAKSPPIIQAGSGPVTGKARVLRGVIHGLLQGRWHGGERLTEADAAGIFQVSRTPVREALLELATLGILELRRNCGAVFLPFGEKELRDLYAVRCLLEVEAARLAARSIDEAVVDHLKGAFEQLRRERRPDVGWRLDRELHAGIAQAAGNPRLMGEIARYAGLVQTMREAVGGMLADIHDTSQAEHLQILRKLKERDAEAAAAAMKAHLDQAAESAVAALMQLRAGRRKANGR